MIDYPFRAELSSALNADFYTIEYLDQRLLEGSAWLWVNERAAIVAEIKEYPTGLRVIHGLVAAGDLGEIRGLVRQAEEWAALRGCKKATIESRSGWLREMKGDGYALFQTCICKDL